MTDPIKHAQDEKLAETASDEVEAPRFGTITFDGVEYGIERKPNTLLISELARTGSGDADALGMFAEFFDVTLGANYKAFRRHMLRSEAGEDETVLQDLLGEILEKTMGRPTE